MGESRFYRVIEWIYAVIVILVLAVLVVLDNRVYYIYQNQCPVPNFVFLLAFAGLAAILYLRKRAWQKSHAGMPQPAPMKMERTMKIIGIMSAILFVAQIIYTYEIYFETGWDCRILEETAYDLAFDGSGAIGYGPLMEGSEVNYYYSVYPNNVFLTGIFAGILKFMDLCNIHAGYYPLILAGCFLVTAAGYFFADCIRILTARKSLIWTFWILFVLLTGLSPWVSIPYSDTYSIFFTTFAMWLFLRKTDENAFASWFGITVVCFVGYFIKPTVILTFMVMVFFEVLHFFVKKDPAARKTKVKKALGFLCMLALGAGLSFGLKIGMEKVTGITFVEDQNFTAMHYLRMGANYEYGGGYNQTDVNASASYATVAERNAGDLSEALTRIREMLPVKWVGFLAKKALTNFNDGTFAWGNEGAFYWAYYERDNGLARTLRSFVYNIGENHDIYTAVMQGLWFFNLCFCALALLKGRRTKDYRETAIYVSMLAIMCFLMVFEARARYLYLYSPIIYMCGALGLNRLLLGKDTK